MSREESINCGPILAPVDFSTHSENALVWAGELARRTGASLVVLHVVHDPAEDPGYYRRGNKGEGELLRIEEAAQAAMNNFLAEVTERHPELGQPDDLESVLVVGLPATRILEVAERIGARQIVMGSQGRTGLKRLMLGSKAEQVVRMSPIPVTIVKG